MSENNINISTKEGIFQAALSIRKFCEDTDCDVCIFHDFGGCQLIGNCPLDWFIEE